MNVNISAFYFLRVWKALFTDHLRRDLEVEKLLLKLGGLMTRFIVQTAREAQSTLPHENMGLNEGEVLKVLANH